MKILKFKPTYKREDGLVVINNSSISFPNGFKNKFQSSVVFPPGSIGGNHKHPRTEFFYSFGDLILIYLDEDGKKHEVSMGPENGEYKLFEISSNLSHAVINKTDKELIMIEFANEEQHDVEVIKLI